MKFKMRATLTAFAAVVSILVILRIVSIISEGEEGRLKKTIYKAKRCAERENIISLTNYISPNYHDELENDRHSLLSIAKSFFDNYRNILILISSMEIAVDGELATAQIEATIYWQEETSEEIIYDTAKVEAKFRKEDRRWRLTEMRFFEPEKRRYFQPMIG